MRDVLDEHDLRLLAEGAHDRPHQQLGAHPRELAGVEGVGFALWAPNARAVRLLEVGAPAAPAHPMRKREPGGIWELFLPGASRGMHYDYEVTTSAGDVVHKTDPFAFAAEEPPGHAAIVFSSPYRFEDDAWIEGRGTQDPSVSPISVYEVHLGSWRREGGRPPQYRDLARSLPRYAADMGFTHVEFLPVGEHPFRGSWGYQTTHYFAPSARYGQPDDLKFLIDALHRAGIGVIIDWVPAHFPIDDWALARFDGTPLYEDPDPLKGHHPDWGTLVFDYSRPHVRSFLISNALYWIEEFHVDGIRVDAVASMLYLDYSRKKGEWRPNRLGGRENLEAIEFITQLTAKLHAEHPDVLLIAEESGAWPGVTRPSKEGGLGFDLKWNLGWMHDTLDHFGRLPRERKKHLDELTFTLMYAWSERYILPLSHDEVVHEKGSLQAKMPGGEEERLGWLRVLFAYMWAYPGKKLLFMGGELAQPQEWDHDSSIAWDLLDDPGHLGMQRLVRDLNHLYSEMPALWQNDPSSDLFHWTGYDAIASFVRADPVRDENLVCICNLGPRPREPLLIGVPRPGPLRVVLHSEAEVYGGSVNAAETELLAEPRPAQGMPCSLAIPLPSPSAVWLRG